MTKKQRAEWFQFGQLVSVLIEDRDHLSFPLTVVHDDMPDFHVSHSGGSIGVETSEYKDEEFRVGEIIQDKLGGSICVTGLKDRGERRSNDDLINSMYGRPIEWEAAAERSEHVLKKITTAIETKCRKFSKFKVFDRNWLVLSENHNPIECVINWDAISQGLLKLSSQGVFGNEYDRILVCYGDIAWNLEGGQVCGARLPKNIHLEPDRILHADGRLLATREVRLH